MLIVVTYHYVRPSRGRPSEGIQGISPDGLAAQLGPLGMAGDFVSVSQVRDAMQGGRPLPRRALLVTFDDGLREQVDYALPVLDRLGIPAIFFVNTWPIANRAVSTVHKIHLLLAHTSPGTFRALLTAEGRRQGIEVRFGVEPRDAAISYPWDSHEVAQLKYFLNHQLGPDVKDALVAPCFRYAFGDDEAIISRALYMDLDQLRVLGTRGYLGTHGDRHLPLGRLSGRAVRESVRVSLHTLVEWTGVRPFALAYPFGSLGSATIEAGAAAAAAGVQLAFTTERAANVDLRQPLHLARFDCNDLPGGRRPCFALETLFESVPPARWHRDRCGQRIECDVNATASKGA